MLEESTDEAVSGNGVTLYANNGLSGHSNSRLHTIQQINKSIPKNNYGMPAFIYRADLIPTDIDQLSGSEREEALVNATIDIQYTEGFPALPNGTPLWGQLPFEDTTAYDLFRQYMELAEKYGVRRLDLLNADRPNFSRETLIEYHTYYYWAGRCKALDLFEVAAAQKMRERRILRTNDRHFLEADKILGKVLAYFNKLNEDGEPIWLKDLTPKTAMDMLDKLTKIQRVSLGMAAHGSSSGEDGDAPRNAGIEMVLRTIAQKSGETESQNTGNSLDLLLNDPESALIAQEMILKINAGGRKREISEASDTPLSVNDIV